MRIDAHIHTFSPGFFPPEWFAAMEHRWTMAQWPPRPAEAIRGRVEAGMMDPHGTFIAEALQAASMDRALWMGLDPWVLFRPNEPGSGRQHLEHQAALVGGAGGRLVGIAGIDPRRRDVAELAAAAFDEHAMAGLKIYPPHGYLPQDPSCRPMYEACVDHGGVAVVHSAATQYPLLSHYSNPLYLQEVQLAYPSLTLVIAHAGFPMWWQEAATVAGGHPSTYLEISHWDRLIDTDPDQLLRVLKHWRRTVGAHRMLFGTDYFGGPRFTGRVGAIDRWAAYLGGCGVFDAAELELIMGGNAARIIPAFAVTGGATGTASAAADRPPAGTA